MDKDEDAGSSGSDNENYDEFTKKKKSKRGETIAEEERRLKKEFI